MACDSDLELGDLTGSGYSTLSNANVRSFAWSRVTVQVKDGRGKARKTILDDVHGIVESGELLAVMGPSGAGKSTLLDVLAHRRLPNDSLTQANLFLNGASAKPRDLRNICAYVEQQDALIGSLTVRETLEFAAKLTLPKSITATDRIHRVDAILRSFGLVDQAETLVGTAVRKGISGGQKRRLSVAEQLITSPCVLFLDEPTSGLDSAAALEVMSFLKRVAREHNLIVIASIHQPSAEVFREFDKLLLLARGRTAYSGSVADIRHYFEVVGRPIAPDKSLADFAIESVSTDFTHASEEPDGRPSLADIWPASDLARELQKGVSTARAQAIIDHPGSDNIAKSTASSLDITTTLIHRSFIKSYRDVIAYGVRMLMYIGLALLMGTVWLRLAPVQENIQSFINAIFFGGAFMSFMAVAYIPAFLEDYAILRRERANGRCGPGQFCIANFVVGMPYLFLFSLAFSLIAYWLSNFRSDAGAFFTWTLWLFLDLLAAESLVILVSALVPVFVVALAGTAFVNGLWMCTGGFLVRTQSLNVVYRYFLHYINYQWPVFTIMMVNELSGRQYKCAVDEDGSCRCSYQSSLQEQCLIDGSAILEDYGFEEVNTWGYYILYMSVIIFVYRVLGYVVMKFRR